MYGRRILATLALAAACGAAAQVAQPQRIVLQGYDSVAYFTEQRPVKGSSEYSREWDGALYYFASARNRDLFAADPERYSPQFSGFCANAMSYGKRLEADPLVWKIIDGRLYVFLGEKGRERVEKDPSVLTRAAEKARER